MLIIQNLIFFTIYRLKPKETALKTTKIHVFIEILEGDHSMMASYRKR